MGIGRVGERERRRGMVMGGVEGEGEGEGESYAGETSFVQL